jgi:hypothetical protein
MVETSWRLYSNALARLLSTPDLRSAFEEDLGNEIGKNELHLSVEMAQDLRRIIFLIDDSVHSSSEATTTEAQSEVEKSLSDAEAFFRTTFDYVKRSTLVTAWMSGVMFLMGLVLLALAAVQAMQGQVAGAAIALAASGLGAIAVAFYKSPVQQMRASAAEMQKSNMLLMSYMLGVGLVGRTVAGQDTTEAARLLTALTSDLVTLLGPAPAATTRKN